MPGLNTPLDVYKLLPRANCGECGINTCMAFAAAVIKQEKELAGCSRLDKNIAGQFEGGIVRQVNLDSIREGQLKELQDKIKKIDLLSRAVSAGARVQGENLVITCLGKEFEVDGQGTVKSHCHTHAWFSIPLLDYLVANNGSETSGTWVPFRDLPHGGTWSRLFEQRCEKPMKEIADSHADLFEDLIGMFSARSAQTPFKADISVVLYPLPGVPLLICYWKPEEGMESKLHLFFDDTAESRLHIDSLFTLATGIVMMLEKIMLKHSR